MNTAANLYFKNITEDYSPKNIPFLLDTARKAAGKPYPDSYMLPLPDLSAMASSLPRCPATVQLSNEISLYLEITGKGLGYVSPDNWRCDLAYTLTDALSGNIWSIVSENQESTSDRRKVLSDLGYEIQECHGNSTSLEEMKEILKSILYQQQPVVIRYLPEHFFGGIVVGYEEQGEVLLGLSFNAFDFTPGILPVIKKNRDWYQADTLLYTLNNQTGQKDIKELYMAALQRAKASLFENGALQNKKIYRQWKRILSLSREELYKELQDSPEAFSRLKHLKPEERRNFSFPEILTPIVDPLWCEYAENRYYAAHFMRQAGKYAEEFTDSSHAAELSELFEETARSLDKVNPLAYEYIGKVDGIDPINLEKLSDDSIRKEMGSIVAQWEALEEEMSVPLLKILELLGL